MSNADPDMHIAPQNIESEEAVLGALVVRGESYREVLALRLSERDFYRPSHRILFRVLMDMYERGEEPDDLTLVAELKHRKLLQDAGGAAEVMSLGVRCPVPANAGAYAAEVIDQAQRRCVVDTGHEIARMGYENTRANVTDLSSQVMLVVDRAMAYLKRSSARGRTSEDLAEWASEHLLTGGEARDWYPYPLASLQEATGGFASGQLIVIGAESSVGKSCFGQGFLLGVPEGKRAGYFNLEMTAEEVQLRLVSTLTGIAVNRISQPRLDGTFDLSEAEQDEYLSALEQLNQIDYTVHDCHTLSEIENTQRAEKYDLIIVDHMHRLPESEDYQGLVRITRSMKNLCLTTGCANVTLAQFNRGDELLSGEAPTLRRLKGGNVIEEEADVALLLHRKKDEHGYRMPEGQVIVAKNRNGTSGYAVPTVFNGSRMRWEDKR